MSSSSSVSAPIEKTRVLVVEDHDDCLLTMVELLSGAGCEVRSARNGPDAVAIARDFQPDVMFLDLGLPVMSGYEVARILRADPRTAGMMIVAVTGYGMPQERERSTSAGIDLHLVKPVPFQQLHAALNAATTHVPAQRQNQTVLVVDDNAAGRYATARGLGAAGFKVLEASTGKEAIELAVRAHAMVLDVFLPDLDGRQVCRALRAQVATANLPIVHVSSVCVSELDADEGRRAGGDAYLVTPVPTITLARVIDSLIAARS
jgi:CheY-like chemotaxis protein